ncbi:multicopper oxidase family protein [Stakelama saccharophila]|uniref:Multicopper oxidase domain-containing protein n=1 Tax=Stakelama saccharophila TaxID=3075605 RepID=A0ABZ0B7W1_9SPHN|nr:multicopper oxidase domain-containing protein [Stakelama sp. W311]WNO53511.1 multicopper oxidase domain-containing protein [Stakelama sp. W311]
MIGRRQLVAGAALGGGMIVAGVTLPGLFDESRTAVSGGTGDRKPLNIPPLLPGVQAGGARQFSLRLQKGVSEFIERRTTPTIGINSAYLGPTLEMHAGERVRMSVVNALDEPATLHWHGFNLPAAADGGPHQPIAPGETWSPSFEIRERGAMFWYHSHMHRRAGPQVYHGLAGAIYVRDRESERLALPGEYGVDDVPLILQDRSFGSAGELIYSPSMMNRMMGVTGDTLLVNGGIGRTFDAGSDRLRLRLLNGSNARFYRLSFSDGRSFHLIGTDGGLLAAALRTDHVILAPAERAQIIVDLQDGLAVKLLAADARRTMMRGGMMARGADRGERFVALDIRPGEARRRWGPLPRRLVDLAPPDASKAVRKRRFVLDMPMGMMRGGGFTINGRSMDMQRIDEAVTVGTDEIWEIENASMMAHPFHVHNVQFRVLDRDGRPASAAELGLKDVVVVRPRERVRILVRFEEYTDRDLPYMYHCHILEHEDAGMMGQFVVRA